MNATSYVLISLCPWQDVIVLHWNSANCCWRKLFTLYLCVFVVMFSLERCDVLKVNNSDVFTVRKTARKLFSALCQTFCVCTNTHTHTHAHTHTHTPQSQSREGPSVCPPHHWLLCSERRRVSIPHRPLPCLGGQPNNTLSLWCFSLFFGVAFYFFFLM